MQLVSPTELPLFSSTIPNHAAAFVLYWHEFKNCVAVEIGRLHSKPLLNSHFLFFIIVEWRLFKCCFSGPNYIPTRQDQDYRVDVSKKKGLLETKDVD